MIVKIQNRRGQYVDFDPSKLLPGEFAIVQTGDPNTADGKSIYICVTAGNVKQIATLDELQSEVETALQSAIPEVVEEATQEAQDAADRAEAAAQTLEIDTTLTETGQAAEAKATGDAIDELNERLDDIGDLMSTDYGNGLIELFIGNSGGKEGGTMVYGTSTTIYLSNTAGSDSNDGLTEQTPLQTLNKAITVGFKRSISVDIRILDGSTYETDYIFNGAALNIIGADGFTPSVIVNGYFVNCRFDVSGANANSKVLLYAKLPESGTAKLNFNNSTVNLTFVDLHSTVYANNSGLMLRGCTASTPNSDDTDYFLLQNSRVFIFTSFTVNASDGVTNLFDVQAGLMCLNCTMTGSFAGSGKAMMSNTSIVIGTATRINSFSPLSASNGGIYLRDGSIYKP